MSLTDRLPRVIATMEALLDMAVPSGPYRDLSRKLIVGAERQASQAASNGDWIPFIDLAFDVTAATGGDLAQAVNLAAATAFVFSGLDVIDDLADGDTQPQWADVPPEQQTLAGISALVSYPQLIIAGMPLAAEMVSAMQTALSRRILSACAGQSMDLALAGAPAPTAEAVEASVGGKSGEQLALYCEWAALAAGLPVTVVDAYAAYGHALGTACQIRGDLSELCHDDWCRDLASGNRTLPVAYHLTRPEGQQAAFLELLERARSDRNAQLQVRQALLDSGAVRTAVLAAQVHAERGRRALALTRCARAGQEPPRIVA